MVLRKKNKNGLFLSIETAAVIIILALIVILVIAGLSQLVKVYKIYRISREVSMYSEAVASFKTTYEYFPGDLPNSLFNGNLRNTGLLADYSLVCPATALSGAADSGTMASDTTCGNGRVSMIKSTLAFRQLALTKMIPSSSVETAITVGNGSADGVVAGTLATLQKIDKQSGLSYPYASFDKSLIWVFGLDDSSSSKLILGSIAYPDLLNTAGATQAGYGVYGTVWAGKPRLILVKAKDVTAAAQIDVTKAFGGLSAIMAASIDVKIDDGLPSGSNSRVIGENTVIATTGGGCTSIVSNGATPILNSAQLTTGVAVGTTPLGTSILGASYQRNKASDGLKGCIMTFGIDLDS